MQTEIRLLRGFQNTQLHSPHEFFDTRAISLHMRRNRMRFERVDAFPLFDDNYFIGADVRLHGNIRIGIDGRAIFQATVLGFDLRNQFAELSQKCVSSAGCEIDCGDYMNHGFPFF